MTSRRSASLNFRVMISPVYLTSLSERTLGWYLGSCSWPMVKSSGLGDVFSWTALPFLPISSLARTTGALALTSALGTSSVFATVMAGAGGGGAGFWGG